jgi:hypothetical protein
MVAIIVRKFVAGKVTPLALWIAVIGIIAVAAALAAGVSYELRMPRSWTERVINVAAIDPFWAFAVILVIGVADHRLPNLYYGGLGGLAIRLSTFSILIYVWSLELAPGKIKLLRAQPTIREATINAFPSRRLHDMIGYGIPLALVTVALAGVALYGMVGFAPYSIDGSWVAHEIELGMISFTGANIAFFIAYSRAGRRDPMQPTATIPR